MWAEAMRFTPVRDFAYASYWHAENAVNKSFGPGLCRAIEVAFDWRSSLRLDC